MKKCSYSIPDIRLPNLRLKSKRLVGPENSGMAVAEFSADYGYNIHIQVLLEEEELPKGFLAWLREDLIYTFVETKHDIRIYDSNKKTDYWTFGKVIIEP